MHLAREKRGFGLVARLSGGLVLALALTLPARAEPPGLWTLEPESRVGFVATQGGSPVEARFDVFEAEIRFDPAQLAESRLWVEIDLASVNSESADRDQTIRSRDLFDVATWPRAVFEAERFEALGEDAFEAKGRLTLRDVTLDLVLPFTLEIADHPEEPGVQRARALGEVILLRLDYGVGQGQWQDTSMVPNEVKVVVEILAHRSKP